MTYPLSTGCAGSSGQTAEAMRSALRRVQYRILYFFHGKEVAVLAGGLSKAGQVPDGDIERALRRRVAFEKDPSARTFVMEL